MSDAIGGGGAPVAPVAAPTPNGAPDVVNALDAQNSGEQVETPPVEYWEPDEEHLGKRFKRKIDGEEREFTLKEALDGYSLREASNARMREAAEIRKQHQAAQEEHKAFEAELQAMFRDPQRMFEAMLETDPRNAMAFVENMHRLAIEEAQLTPEQQKLRYYERQEQQRQAEAKQYQEQQAYEAERSAWSSTLSQAQLPKDDPMTRVVYEEAVRAVDHMKRTGQRVSDAQLAQWMKQRHETLSGQMRERLMKTIAPPQQEATPQNQGRPMIAGVQNGNQQPRSQNGQFTRQVKVYDEFG